MKLPKSYNELTVRQYQGVDLILKEDIDHLDKQVKLISHLSGKTIEEVENNTPKQILEWAKTLTFLSNINNLTTSINKRVFINGRFYCPIIGAEKLLASQLVTLKHLEEQNKPTELLNQMLACIYVDMDWLGRPKKFDSNTFERTAKDMLDARLGEVYGTLFFYSNVLEKSSPIILTYLNEANQTIAEVMPEVMAWAKSQGLTTS